MKKRHTLGSLLFHARQDRNLTLRDIEIRSKNSVSNSHLSKIENGVFTHPSPKILKTLSEILSLNYVELMILAGHLTKKDLH